MKAETVTTLPISPRLARRLIGGRNPEIPEHITGMSLPVRLDSDPPPQRNPSIRPTAEQIVADMAVMDALKRETMLHTRMYWRGIPLLISTVPLMIDHQYMPGGPPMLWETMIFADGTYEDHACWRYSTKAAAYAGHARIVAALRRARTPVKRVRPTAITSGWPKR